MKALRDTLGIILIIFFFSNCAKKNFESSFMNELSKDTSFVEFLSMVENFETYLLKHNFITDIDKQNYKVLMNKAIRDEIVLQADSNFYNEVEAWLFTENFSFGQNGFNHAVEFWDGKIDTLSSAYKLAQIQRKIMEKGDLGDSLLNSQLIESINDSDFKKAIYRVPINYIIYEILERNYSYYHEWKTVDNVYFQENSVEIDFDKSNFDSLDSICAIISPDNYTLYEFLALGTDNKNDSLNYSLTVDRTSYILAYLVEKKGLHPRQVVQYRLPKNSQLFRFDTFKELFQKRNAQLVYKERYFTQ